MKIIDAAYQILSPDLDSPYTASHIYQIIELSGRTCYKSEKNITDESAEKFVRNIIKNGHEAMLEHIGMTVKFIVDRGISHELVRHRLASFAQESTRYCNYSSDKFGHDVTFIRPYFLSKYRPEAKEYWLQAMHQSEKLYFAMLESGCTPQEARTVLPSSLKTEVIMTANFREWRHFLKLRAAGETGAPHPQMLEVAIPLLNECKQKLPALFYDIDPYKGMSENMFQKEGV